MHPPEFGDLVYAESVAGNRRIGIFIRSKIDQYNIVRFIIIFPEGIADINVKFLWNWFILRRYDELLV